MNNRKIIWIILFAIGCNSNVTEITDEENIIELKFLGEKVFPLDSSSSNIFFSQQIFESDKSKKFAYYNQPDKEIKIYDFTSSELENSLHFDSEGPFGVGRIGYMHFFNRDSLLIFDYIPQAFYFTNLKDSILKKVNFHSRSEVYSRNILPRLARGQQALIENNKIILTTPDNLLPNHSDFPDEFKNPNNHVIIEVDNLGNRLDWGSYPKDYNNTIFNQKFYDVYFSASLSDPGSVLLSFPASDSIYVYDSQRKLKETHKMGFEFERRKLTKTKDNRFIDAISQMDYEKLTKNNYAEILGDPYKEYYFRFVELAKTEDEIESELENRYLREIKRFKILVFDKLFIYKGTIIFPANQKYNFYNSFITEDGVFIYNVDKNLKSEETIIFDHFVYDF